MIDKELITNLKNEIYELKEENKELKENRDKAIEYINGESPDAGVSGNYIKKVLEGDK